MVYGVWEFHGNGTVSSVGPVLDETISLGDPFEINWFSPQIPVDEVISNSTGLYQNVTLSFNLNNVVSSHSKLCVLNVTNNIASLGKDSINISCPSFDLSPIGSASFEEFSVTMEDYQGAALSSDEFPANMEDLGIFWDSSQILLQYSAMDMESPINSTIVGNFDSPSDIDDDGIFDFWEINGLDFDLDGDIDIDFNSLGANPNHKDIFVEIDYMAMHKPPQNAIDDVIASFADAPQNLVNNPDGLKGINLHMHLDEELPLQGPTLWEDFDSLKKIYFGSPEEREDASIIDAKKYFYHYGLFIHEFTDDRTGSGEKPGDDFMVVAYQSQPKNYQAGTLMHELGHNLGLSHGGQDNTNCKPNYLSVMNYAFQWDDFIPGRPLDYSREINGHLDEISLNENTGIPGPSGRQTVVGFENNVTQRTFVDIPFDFNSNNSTSDTGVSRNINHIPDIACSGAGEVLTGNSDWDKIVYDFRAPEIPFGDGYHPLSAVIVEDFTKEGHDRALENLKIDFRGNGTIIAVTPGFENDPFSAGDSFRVEFIYPAMPVDVNEDPHLGTYGLNEVMLKIGDDYFGVGTECVAQVVNDETETDADLFIMSCGNTTMNLPPINGATFQNLQINFGDEDGLVFSNDELPYNLEINATAFETRNFTLTYDGEFMGFPLPVFVSGEFSSVNCGIPTNGDWILLEDCELESDAITPANIFIQNNSLLIIPSGISLTIPSGSHLVIQSGSGVLIKSGGTLLVG